MVKGLELFYGYGYVERDYLSYSEGQLAVMGLNAQYPVPTGHEWYGIPPVPTWLSWFGRPYAPLVAPSLRKRGPAGIREEEDGIFVMLGEQPADLHQLQALGFELSGELLARRDDANDVLKQLKKLEGTCVQTSQCFRARAAAWVPRIDG